MRPLPSLLLPAAVVLLAACGPANVGASPELASVFAFAAYPAGTLLHEEVYTDFYGPFQAPGRQGYREYQTADSPRQVRSYYEGLAARNGWSFVGPSDVGGVLYASLTHGRFRVEVTTAVPEGVKQPPMPVESGAATPTPSPSPTPAGSPSPFVFRIQANVGP